MIKTIGRLAHIGKRMSFGVLPETLISFLIVGTFGVAVHLAVLKTAMFLITDVFQFANLMAMLLAATFNYFVNNQSTFREKLLVGKNVVIGYLGYLCITSLGMVISYVVSSKLYARHDLPVLAALGGIVAGSLWNYFMSYNFVWKLLFKLTNRAS